MYFGVKPPLPWTYPDCPCLFRCSHSATIPLSCVDTIQDGAACGVRFELVYGVAVLNLRPPEEDALQRCAVGTVFVSSSEGIILLPAMQGG